MTGMAIVGVVELSPSGETDIVGTDLCSTSSSLEIVMAIDDTAEAWLAGGTGNGELLRGMTGLMSKESAESGNVIVGMTGPSL
jgi:hypothetical protein